MATENLPPRIAQVGQALDQWRSRFPLPITGIIGIGSFFNPQTDHEPRDIDLAVVVQSEDLPAVMASASRKLIVDQINDNFRAAGLHGLSAQVGFWPRIVTTCLDPLLEMSIKRGLLLAGQAPIWPID